MVKVADCSRSNRLHWLAKANRGKFTWLRAGGNFLADHPTIQFYILPIEPRTNSESINTLIMGQPSTQASNAIIYLTYAAFLYVQSPCK
jgi:hypothetical protein